MNNLKDYANKSNEVILDLIEPGALKNQLTYASIIPVVGRLCQELQPATEYLIHRETVRQEDALALIAGGIGEDENLRARLVGLTPSRLKTFTELASFATLLVENLANLAEGFLAEKDGYELLTKEGEYLCQKLAYRAMEESFHNHEYDAFETVAGIMGLYSAVNLIAMSYHNEDSFTTEARNSVISHWLSQYTSAISLQRKAIIDTHRLQEINKNATPAEESVATEKVVMDKDEVDEIIKAD